MPSTKPFSILAEQIDRDPEWRRRVDEMKRAMRDAERLTASRNQRMSIEGEVAEIIDFSSLLGDERNVYLSTLRDYIEALGGELELTARFPDGEVIKFG